MAKRERHHIFPAIMTFDGYDAASARTTLSCIAYIARKDNA